MSNSIFLNINTITAKTLKDHTFAAVIPEFYALSKITENGSWHVHQNELDHVIAVYEELENLLQGKTIPHNIMPLLQTYLSLKIEEKSRTDLLLISTLLHDIAKTDTLIQLENGHTRCPDHELIGSTRVKFFAERFKLTPRQIEYVERTVKFHNELHKTFGKLPPNHFNDTCLKQFKKVVGDIEIELVLLSLADMRGSDLALTNKTEFQERTRILFWILNELTSR